MSAFIIDVKPDNLLCANPAKKDRNFENYFTGEIRTKIDNLPFNLYTNYKVYIKDRFILQDKTVPIRQANRGIKLMEDYLNGR